jgi:hypothetical protein
MGAGGRTGEMVGEFEC